MSFSAGIFFYRGIRKFYVDRWDGISDSFLNKYKMHILSEINLVYWKSYSKCVTSAFWHCDKQGACSKASGSVPSIRRDVIGVGAECSPVPSGVDRRSLRTWSAVDKATETEQEDTENDDVPLSGLLQCSRRDTDDAQVLNVLFKDGKV